MEMIYPNLSTGCVYIWYRICFIVCASDKLAPQSHVQVMFWFSRYITGNGRQAIIEYM